MAFLLSGDIIWSPGIVRLALVSSWSPSKGPCVFWFLGTLRNLSCIPTIYVVLLVSFLRNNLIYVLLDLKVPYDLAYEI